MVNQRDSKNLKSADSGELSMNKGSKRSSQERTSLLDPDEAEAGGPAGIAVCGEEDPGSALEFWVEEDEQKARHKNNPPGDH